MKKLLLSAFALCVMGAGVTQGQTKAVRLYIAPNSTVTVPDIMKNMASKCPNTTITIDSQNSDFMLHAWGWSGNYRFTLFQRGGTAVYGTTTAMLSNAVKDVCQYLKSPHAANLSPRSLNAVRDALTNADHDLLKSANQSDYVQKAIALLDQALDDAKQAAAHVNDDADAAAAPPEEIPNFDAPPPPAPRTNFMQYSALNDLKVAYDSLNRVPGGGFGGYRTLINNDIAAASEVLVTGIDSYNARHPQ